MAENCRRHGAYRVIPGYTGHTGTKLRQTAPNYAVCSLSSFEVTEDQVRSILLETNRNKACGPDGVSARIVHECARELAVTMAKLCRLSLEQGVCPKAWKRANVVPIFKKGISHAQ